MTNHRFLGREDKMIGRAELPLIRGSLGGMLTSPRRPKTAGEQELSPTELRRPFGTTQNQLNRRFEIRRDPYIVPTCESRVWRFGYPNTSLHARV
jgi:hypothetical protein